MADHVLILPSQEELNRIHREMKVYPHEPRLRWIVPPFTTAEPPRLQEAIPWRSDSAEGVEWRDVPTVVLEDAERKDWGAMTKPAFGKWLPIETAPKDGTDVLLWWPVQRQTGTGAWMSPSRQYVEHWCRDRRWSPGEDPTHWMPLPAPPHPATDADLGEGGEGV